MIPDYEKLFSNKELLVLFTTSPAGLGHIRVTEALKDALNKKVNTEIIGLHHPKFQLLHRIASRNLLLRLVVETFQSVSLLETIFITLFRPYLRNFNSSFREIVSLVEKRKIKPSYLVIISTHHSLAHQIAAIKDKLAKRLKLCVILVVVVTDDSPQKIWGVEGADYIAVPSYQTKEKLTQYLMTLTKNPPEIFVSPYPLPPSFSRKLNREEIKNKKSQVDSKGSLPMKIIIPISGAAVQLDYLEKLIRNLPQKKTEITVVSRLSPYTRKFLSSLEKQPHIRVVARIEDWKVVKNYENEYTNNIFSLEITKPSEQTFKAVLSPQQIGGSILLFSHPIGKQEKDNLEFLERHGLIPLSSEKESIEELSEKASNWRGIMLPQDGKKAAEYIIKLRDKGIFESMLNFKEIENNEISSNGVTIFWEKLAQIVSLKCSLPL